MIAIRKTISWILPRNTCNRRKPPDPAVRTRATPNPLIPTAPPAREAWGVSIRCMSIRPVPRIWLSVGSLGFPLQALGDSLFRVATGRDIICSVEDLLHEPHHLRNGTHLPVRTV